MSKKKPKKKKKSPLEYIRYDVLSDIAEADRLIKELDLLLDSLMDVANRLEEIQREQEL